MSISHATVPSGGTLPDRTTPTFTDAIDRHDWAELGAERYRREYMDPLKPVVISGAFEHWPARQKWTLDFFRRHYGDLPLEIKGRQLTMAELISEVEISTPAK